MKARSCGVSVEYTGSFLFRSLGRAPPEGIKHPAIFRLLMTKNVEAAVVCQDLETVVANAIPLIQDLAYFDCLSTGLVYEAETEGSFIRLVA